LGRLYRESPSAGTISVLSIDEKEIPEKAVEEYCEAYFLSSSRCSYLKTHAVEESIENRPNGRIVLAINTLMRFQDGSGTHMRFLMRAAEDATEAVQTFCRKWGIMDCRIPP